MMFLYVMANSFCCNKNARWKDVDSVALPYQRSSVEISGERLLLLRFNFRDFGPAKQEQLWQVLIRVSSR